MAICWSIKQKRFSVTPCSSPQPLAWSGTSCSGQTRGFAAARGWQDISWREALIIGLAQALAIVPGISRAGSTITTALLLGIDRVSAARFSFLLSTPIIFGATVLKLKSFLAAGVGIPEITGIVTAALTGYLAIAGLIRFVTSVSYKVFFWYRLALAAVIVAVWFIR